MGDSEKKSVTIRLDEPDLIEWAASQSAAVASIRMAVKICILQYGKDVDLLDAILRAQFGTGTEQNVRQTSEKSQNSFSQKQAITEQISSDNNQNIVTQPTQSAPQPMQQQSVEPVPNRSNPQYQDMNSQISNQNMNNQQGHMSSSLQSLL